MQNYCNYNFFLQEEKWYSSALKEEVDKLEAEKQERLEAYQNLEEVFHVTLLLNTMKMM